MRVVKFTMLGLFLCSFLLLGQGFSKEMVGKGLNMAQAKIEGYSHLVKLVVSENEMSTKGQVARVSYPLATPRPDYRVTSRDVRYFLKHSLLSRCTTSQIQTNSCFCEGRFEEAKVFRNETLDAQAVVAADTLNKLIVVSYRMPLSEKNWDSNNKNYLVSHPSTKGREKVHRGHLEDVLSIHSLMKPVVLAMFKDPEYQNYKLHVTGYSFGASMAAISLPLWMKFIKENELTSKAQLYSYSGPRPGNLEFAKYLESLRVPVIRYTRNGDVIPHIPDQSAGFSQIGQEFYDNNPPLLKKDFVKCNPSTMEDNQCSLKDTKFLARNHYAPLHAPLPIPPYC